MNSHHAFEQAQIYHLSGQSGHQAEWECRSRKTVIFVHRPVSPWLISRHDQSTTNNQTTANNQQSTINNQQSTTNNQQSTINNQQSTINNQQPTTNNQQPTTNNQQSTINIHLISNQQSTITINIQHPPINNDQLTIIIHQSKINRIWSKTTISALNSTFEIITQIVIHTRF